jgi:type IV pilus assembly protein PilC
MEAVGQSFSGTGKFTWDSLRRITVSDLAVFSRQLASLLKAGLPMVQALKALHQQCTNARLARIIQDIEDKLSRDGGTLSEALEDYPRVFNGVYQGLIHAGEEGGRLVEVLNNMAKHLGQSARLKRQVVGAFIYPLFLLVLGTTAVFVLMTFVIPKFQELFASFGGDLPAPTRILISISDFMAAWWWVVLMALLAVVLLVVVGLRKSNIRLNFDRSLLRVPVLGAMFLKLEVARISRTLSALLNSGIPILESLRITSDTVKNLAVKATFTSMTRGVSVGEGLAKPMDKSGIYPPLVINLIRTGEETGELPEMLIELSDIYEDEAERAVTGAVKLLEPSLICIMGGIIAGIVAAIILPIFRANFMVN